MEQSSQKWIENTVGEGEIAHYEQFLLLSQCFQNFYCKHVKTRACLGEGLRSEGFSAQPDSFDGICQASSAEFCLHVL